MRGFVGSILESLNEQRINEYKEREYKVSKGLMNKTKGIYKSLISILDSKKVEKEDRLEKRVSVAVDIVEDAFKFVGGKVSTSDHTPTYFRYDGSVKSYTIGGSISLKYTAGDFNRLAEDLTMAYFKTNGGDCANTMDLISYIKRGKTEYGTVFVLEGLDESKEPFVVDYDIKDYYLVDIYPLSSKSKSKMFKTQKEAESYAIKFLKSLKNKRQIVPNSNRRADIEYHGKIVNSFRYNDVVKE